MLESSAARTYARRMRWRTLFCLVWLASTLSAGLAAADEPDTPAAPSTQSEGFESERSTAAQSIRFGMIAAAFLMLAGYASERSHRRRRRG